MQQRTASLLRARLGVVSLLTIASFATALSSAPQSGATTNARTVTSAHSCPWVHESRRHTVGSADLAEQVVAKMTLAEKAQFVTLSEGHHIENFNTAIP
jgi:hypothetical protein